METADVILCVNKIDKNFKTLLFLLKVIHISNSVLLLFLTGIQCKLLLIRINFYFSQCCGSHCLWPTTIYSANVLFIIQNKFLQKDTKLVLAKALKISMAMHTKDHYSMNERAPTVTA